ncbi:MAG TPA: replication initiator [Nocardioidaceae bacterium]|nr:replication initiator [Nocardioidaceae bacterium]
MSTRTKAAVTDTLPALFPAAFPGHREDAPLDLPPVTEQVQPQIKPPAARHWVHMLGFRGHFATKSRRYSITLGALRRARRRAQALIAEHNADGRPLDLAALEADLSPTTRTRPPSSSATGPTPAPVGPPKANAS